MYDLTYVRNFAVFFLEGLPKAYCQIIEGEINLSPPALELEKQAQICSALALKAIIS